MSHRDRDIFEDIISANFANEMQTKYSKKFEQMDEIIAHPSHNRIFVSSRQKVISIIITCVIQFLFITLLLLNLHIAALIWVVGATFVLGMYVENRSLKVLPPDKQSKTSKKWHDFMRRQEEYLEKRRLEENRND